MLGVVGDPIRVLVVDQAHTTSTAKATNLNGSLSVSFKTHALSILSETPHERVERLADGVGVSDRHLRRRFLAAVGYSPKLFQRILRFQRLLALAKVNCSGRLDDLAILAGYADQAHMTREVGEFADVVPTTLLGNVVSALALSDLLAIGIEPPAESMTRQALFSER